MQLRNCSCEKQIPPHYRLTTQLKEQQMVAVGTRWHKKRVMNWTTQGCSKDDRDAGQDDKRADDNNEMDVHNIHA